MNRQRAATPRLREHPQREAPLKASSPYPPLTFLDLSTSSPNAFAKSEPGPYRADVSLALVKR